MTKIRWSAAASCVATLLVARLAGGHCFETTCDPATEQCGVDQLGCLTDGLPLYWASDCIPFSVQEQGSLKNNVDYATLLSVTQEAFDTWANVDCGGGSHPSFQAFNSGPAQCATAEYNSNGMNA